MGLVLEMVCYGKGQSSKVEVAGTSDSFVEESYLISLNFTLKNNKLSVLLQVFVS